LTEVNGKAVGNIRGILAVKRDTYVLQEEGRLDFGNTFIEVPCTPSTIGTKRKSRSAPNIADSMQHVQYAEKSGMLLGIIDEDKLLDQIKTV
jgi:hypothetical protein